MHPQNTQKLISSDYTGNTVLDCHEKLEAWWWWWWWSTLFAGLLAVDVHEGGVLVTLARVRPAFAVRVLIRARHTGVIRENCGQQTGQNTQEVKNERFTIWTRQNNVLIFVPTKFAFEKATNGQTYIYKTRNVVNT